MPHLGKLTSSILPADVVARYYRLRGDDVIYVTGSDEHGTPIEVEAVQQGIPPKQLTNQNHKRVVELFKKWGILFDNYTRTENPLHKKFVQNFFLKIYDNGYIFTQEMKLPYCPRCDRFLPDRFVEGTCPYCDYETARGDQCEACGHLLEPTELIHPYCTICHSTPRLKKSKHWYFDIPKFTEQLHKYIENNEQLPANARNFSLNLLKEGLEPRPITRDTEWGIQAPFPEAENKTIYVWVEAVLGYISATIEYFKELGRTEEWKEFWFNENTKSLYFIGKDNIPFHTLILPALLLATEEDYNLPWSVDSTEFLLWEDEPFSGSRRIGLWIDEALQLFPADYWRYTILSIRPETKDTNFTWKTIIEKVNSDLNDTLGNFVHRTLTFINQHYTSAVPKPSKLGKPDRDTIQLIGKRVEEIAHNLEQSQLRAALRTAIGLSRHGNRYLNRREPWKTIKTNPKAAANTLYVAVQIIKALTILLAPFIPFTAEKLWNLLQLPGSVHQQKWNEATKPLTPGHKIDEAKPLFHKIEATKEELQAMVERIKSNSTNAE